MRPLVSPLFLIAGLAACLLLGSPAAAQPAPASPAAPAAAERPHRHLSMELTAGLGNWLYVGAALRGELSLPSLPRRSGFLRLGYATGMYNDEYQERFETSFAGVGFRAYDRGNLYFSVEAGALRYRRWTGYGNASRYDSDWELAPYAALGGGYRFGPFDLGANISYPANGVALTFAFDF